MATASARDTPAMVNATCMLVASAIIPSGIAARGVSPKLSMYIPMILP